MRGLLIASLVGAAMLGAVTSANAAGNPALKRIMVSMNGQASVGNARGMEMAFIQTKAWAKTDEFPRWAELAEKGRAAAHAGNLAGAKAVCQECHDAYREQFRNKYGSKSGGGKDDLPKKVD